jgi:outer membrane immunogenic protein
MPKVNSSIRVAIVAGMLAAAAVGPAQAADLWGPDHGGSIKDAPPPYVFSWTGFYIGAQAGLLTGDTQGKPRFGCFAGDALCFAAEQFFSTDYDMTGGLYGGQIGYNFQWPGGAVVGIEGSFAGSTANGDGPSGVGLLVSERDVDWLATLTGRAGYAFGRSLVYVKGGVAWADINTDVRVGGIHILSGGETHLGWTVGVGYEHAITDRVTARLEYAHIDFDSEDHTLKLGGFPLLRSEVEAEFDSLTLGINYKF